MGLDVGFYLLRQSVHEICDQPTLNSLSYSAFSSYISLARSVLPARRQILSDALEFSRHEFFDFRNIQICPCHYGAGEHRKDVIAELQLRSCRAEYPATINVARAFVHRRTDHFQFAIVERPERAIRPAIIRGDAGVHVQCNHFCKRKHSRTHQHCSVNQKHIGIQRGYCLLTLCSVDAMNVLEKFRMGELQTVPCTVSRNHGIAPNCFIAPQASHYCEMNTRA